MEKRNKDCGWKEYIFIGGILTLFIGKILFEEVINRTKKRLIKALYYKQYK